DPADKAVQEFLTKSPPRKGLARPEHWGLAQVLWAPQGDLALRGLTDELVTDIHQLLGAQVSGPGSNHIERKIEDWYLSYYTPTGRLKSGNDTPKLVSIDAQLKEAIARQQDRQEQQKEFEDLIRKVEDLRARKAEVDRLAQDYERKLAAKRPEADKYAALLQERSRCEGQATGTQAQHAALKQRADAINDNRKQIEDANENLTRLTNERVLRDRETRMREGEAEQATAELENVRKERPQTKQAQDEAELARRYLEAKKKEGPLRDRITKLQGLFQAQTTLSSERGTILAPGSKTLANIRKAMTARDEARVRLEAALITVQVVAVKKGSLEVVEGEDPGNRRLSKGSPVEVKGSPQVVVDLPGVGRIRAWGPAASIDELRDAVKKHSDKVIALTREFGTADQRRRTRRSKE
ncbi:MAG: hypothetical protein HW397_292, partial [Dehalococcoidia bacterium]|nr:hypothetical protein [Dehalococcoidia bacterium]